MTGAPASGIDLIEVLAQSNAKGQIELWLRYAAMKHCERKGCVFVDGTVEFATERAYQAMVNAAINALEAGERCKAA
jgi:hypothetical protein